MASLKASDLFSVKDMVFVVTGGGSGLGESMAKALDTNGASKVFILGRREAALERVASEATNKSIIPVVCDITSKESLSAAASEVQKQSPFVNSVIANSGVAGRMTGHRPKTASLAEVREMLWDCSVEDDRFALNVNVIGSFHTFLAFLDLLDAGNHHPDSPGKSGLIQSQFITLSSLAAYNRLENVSYSYDLSKAATQHLAHMLSANFARYGIRANCIAPGLYLSEMTEGFTGGRDLSIPGAMPKSVIPAARAGNAEDIGGAILFLTSRAGAYMNGAVILSDGGSLSGALGSSSAV